MTILDVDLTIPKWENYQVEMKIFLSISGIVKLKVKLVNYFLVWQRHRSKFHYLGPSHPKSRAFILLKIFNKNLKFLKFQNTGYSEQLNCLIKNIWRRLFCSKTRTESIILINFMNNCEIPSNRVIQDPLHFQFNQETFEQIKKYLHPNCSTINWKLFKMTKQILLVFFRIFKTSASLIPNNISF